jgi:hypothetical protein
VLGTFSSPITARLAVDSAPTAGGADDRLLDSRGTASRRITERPRLDRRDPPAKDLQLLLPTRLLEELAAFLPLPLSIVARFVREERRRNSQRG